MDRRGAGTRLSDDSTRPDRPRATGGPRTPGTPVPVCPCRKAAGPYLNGTSCDDRPIDRIRPRCIACWVCPPTPYDLRFRFLGVPVRIHPVVLARHGAPGLARATTCRGLLIWVACVFVSILVHEYGHGLMAQATSRLAVDRALRHGRALLLRGRAADARGSGWPSCLAGPGAGFVLCWPDRAGLPRRSSASRAASISA